MSAILQDAELARRVRIVQGLLERPPTLTAWWREGGVLRGFELCDALGEAGYELVEVRDEEGRLAQCGWRQWARLAAGCDSATRWVSAAEPYVELVPHGHERWVFEATAAMALKIASEGYDGKRAARRMLAELREAAELGRVSLRGLQEALVSEMARGTNVADMCERGGFGGVAGPDTSHLMRAAGLRERSPGHLARTAPYELAASIARAAGPEPWEVAL